MTAFIKKKQHGFKQAKLFFLFFISLHIYGQQNTILIIADDVSPDYFGCFSATTDTANTPIIRTLAENGIRFNKVWSAPVCSPARAEILTGRYPFRTSVGGVITSPASPQIDTAEMSIAKLLKYHAPTTYQTACIGKWHLTVNQPQKRLNPNKLGFDLYSGNFNGAIANYFNYQRVKNGLVDTVTTYASTQTVNDAIGWLDTLNFNQPFFLWLAFNAPHDPFHLPPANLCNTTGLSGTTADINAHPENYFKAAIEAMDTEIGRLINYLEQNNLLDSTNFIFLGDNGNQSQVAQIANPLKSKGTIYHYGVHVPMIITGPAVIDGGRSSDELINTTDIFATIAELSGFHQWRNFIPLDTEIDSRSMLPIIKNQTNQSRSWIFSETFNSPSTEDDGKTIRNENYHLLRFDNGMEELYNQTIDTEENNNLLIDASVMSSTDWSNYYFLCDSLAHLINGQTCQSSNYIPKQDENKAYIFPNPTQGQSTLSIKIPNSKTPFNSITLTNPIGQIFHLPILFSNQILIDISSLPDGIYFMHWDQNKNSTAIKLIKNH